MKDTFTKPQLVHIAVGIVAFITWIGLLIASRFVTDGVGFLATFSDIIMLAKTTCISAVAIATAVGNFSAPMTKDTTKIVVPGPVPTSQAGFIRIRLMVLLAVLSVGAFGLAACSSINGPQATAQSAQASYVRACTAYGAAFEAALHAREAGKLSTAQISQVGQIDKQITPICTGQLPADPVAATQQITAAITSLAVLGAVNHLTK
jgi:hypothetical protein